jgi:protein tyrosine phosphatase
MLASLPKNLTAMAGIAPRRALGRIARASALTAARGKYAASMSLTARHRFPLVAAASACAAAAMLCAHPASALAESAAGPVAATTTRFEPTSEGVQQHRRSGRVAREWAWLCEQAEGSALPPARAALRSENRRKNRYGDVLPFDHSRVVLEPLADAAGKVIPGSDYINANSVQAHDGHVFIAAQAPTPGTQHDFWRLVQERNIRCIVMLTEWTERGRVKADDYLGLDDAPGSPAAPVEHEIISRDGFTVRKVRFGDPQNAEREPLEVVHFHFHQWPDYGIPNDPYDLLRLRSAVEAQLDEFRNAKSESAEAPQVLVHCSAGIGRTGVWGALDSTLHQIERGVGRVSIFEAVQQMRQYRYGMVQTLEQYEFVYESVEAFLRQREQDKGADAPH